MHMAEVAKIKTVPHSLIRFENGELCYITKRIDRDDNGNKIPMEDMCQISERLTEYKYKGSYEQIAQLILKFWAVPKLDLVNFWEQVYFSALSFICAKGGFLQHPPFYSPPTSRKRTSRQDACISSAPNFNCRPCI